MIIRRFTGTDVDEVQASVVEALGSSAVIISVRYYQKGFFSKLFGRYYVEIVAAIEHAKAENKEVTTLKKMQTLAESLDRLKERQKVEDPAQKNPHP